MKDEWIERLHDQARNEMGFCLQAPSVNWCDQHQALKFPGHEACRVLSVAYDVAESAGEVMEEMVRADMTWHQKVNAESAVALMQWRDDLRAKVEAEGHTRFCATEDESPAFPDQPCTCLRGRVLALIDGEVQR